MNSCVRVDLGRELEGVVISRVLLAVYSDCRGFDLRDGAKILSVRSGGGTDSECRS